MKKCFSFLLSFIIIFNAFTVFSEELPLDDSPKDTLTEELEAFRFSDDLKLFAESAILIDANNLQVLYSKDPKKKLYPASTTKIMTAILAIEHGDLKDVVTVDKEVPELTKGSHIALDVGEQLTLEELLHALLIASSNDSALAIAKHISGSIDAFVELMNSKAKDLGAKDTHFVNPNGLHDDQHYTTAYDLALIGQYAMKSKVFRNIVKEYLYELPATNKKNESRFLKSSNRLIYSTREIDVNGEMRPTKYEGATGIKTGYTSEAHNCLVSSVEKDGRNLIAVVLNSNAQNLFSDSHKLFDYGFKNLTNISLGSKNEFIKNFKPKKAKPQYVAGVLADDVSYNLHNNESDEFRTVLREKELKLPIKKGDSLATVQYYIKDKKIAEADVVSTMDVKLDKKALIPYKILSKWYLLVFALMFSNRLKVYKRRKRILNMKKGDNPSL